MAPHLTSSELDQILEWKGHKSTKEIHDMLAEQRTREGVQPICLSAIRKALHGNTHRRGRSETRGRKRRVSARAVEVLDRARKRLQEKVDGEDEVTWPQIVKAARVRKVDPTTAARPMKAAGNHKP